MGAAAEQQPNFIVILTDDQGYGDLSCMGARDLRTPHLDRLAASGARFTNWYANSAVCSPSRASLLTGRYPANAGVSTILAGHRAAKGIPREVPTLAEALKPLGYRSYMSGKWHLGTSDEYRPHHRGFDEWFGFLAGCVDYYSHIFYWNTRDALSDAHMTQASSADPLHDLWLNDQEIWRNGEYLTELITQHALSYIRSAVSSAQPFFLYVSYNAPHYPMHAPPAYVDRFPHLAWDRQVMAAMLGAVDDGVGEIVDELERHGIRDHTAIFFQSDNGPSRETRNWLDGTPDPYYGGTAGGLKGHKFTLFEGGIRVPAILSWPDRVPAGHVIDEVGAGMDVFPTFLKAAGSRDDLSEVDGLDILPMASGVGSTPHDELYWSLGKQTAIRRGRWKLVLNGQLEEGSAPEEEIHLSDLVHDMSERINLAESVPDITAELKASAETWRSGIELRRKDQR